MSDFNFLNYLELDSEMLHFKELYFNEDFSHSESEYCALEILKFLKTAIVVPEIFDLRSDAHS